MENRKIVESFIIKNKSEIVFLDFWGDNIARMHVNTVDFLGKDIVKKCRYNNLVHISREEITNHIHELIENDQYIIFSFYEDNMFGFKYFTRPSTSDRFNGVHCEFWCKNYMQILPDIFLLKLKYDVSVILNARNGKFIKSKFDMVTSNSTDSENCDIVVKLPIQVEKRDGVFDVTYEKNSSKRVSDVLTLLLDRESLKVKSAYSVLQERYFIKPNEEHAYDFNFLLDGIICDMKELALLDSYGALKTRAEIEEEERNNASHEKEQKAVSLMLSNKSSL